MTYNIAQRDANTEKQTNKFLVVFYSDIAGSFILKCNTEECFSVGVD